MTPTKQNRGESGGDYARNSWQKSAQRSENSPVLFWWKRSRLENKRKHGGKPSAIALWSKIEKNSEKNIASFTVPRARERASK